MNYVIDDRDPDNWRQTYTGTLSLPFCPSVSLFPFLSPSLSFSLDRCIAASKSTAYQTPFISKARVHADQPPILIQPRDRYETHSREDGRELEGAEGDSCSREGEKERRKLLGSFWKSWSKWTLIGLYPTRTKSSKRRTVAVIHGAAPAGCTKMHPGASWRRGILAVLRTFAGRILLRLFHLPRITPIRYPYFRRIS